MDCSKSLPFAIRLAPYLTKDMESVSPSPGSVLAL